MRRGLMVAVLAAFLGLLGCDGGENSSSIVRSGEGTLTPPVQLPKPTNPGDPDEWESESEEPRHYTQVTSAAGATPPPPPVIVR